MIQTLMESSTNNQVSREAARGIFSRAEERPAKRNAHPTISFVFAIFASLYLQFLSGQCLILGELNQIQ